MNHPRRPDKAAGRSSSSDRRSSPRYPPTENAARVGWYSGEMFRAVPALLLDVSLRGVSLTLVGEPPATNQPVWVCLEHAGPNTWVEATVIRTTRTLRGLNKVRLEFGENCPYAFFKAAVYGSNAFQDGSSGSESPEFDPRYWR